MANAQTDEPSVMLMESGALTAHSLGDAAGSRAEVHRGMLVQTGEGQTAGRVAAVVLDQEQQKVTHILLMSERKLLEYRLLPVELIEEVDEEAVLLRIFQSVAENWPIWHGV